MEEHLLFAVRSSPVRCPFRWPWFQSQTSFPRGSSRAPHCPAGWERWRLARRRLISARRRQISPLHYPAVPQRSVRSRRVMSSLQLFDKLAEEMPPTSSLVSSTILCYNLLYFPESRRYCCPFPLPAFNYNIGGAIVGQEPAHLALDACGSRMFIDDERS